MKNVQPVTSNPERPSSLRGAYDPLPIAVGEVEAAKAIGMSVFFLRKDRRTKRVIPYLKIGDRVVYCLDRVRAALLAMEEGGPAARQVTRISGRAR